MSLYMWKLPRGAWELTVRFRSYQSCESCLSHSRTSRPFTTSPTPSLNHDTFIRSAGSHRSTSFSDHKPLTAPHSASNSTTTSSPHPTQRPSILPEFSLHNHIILISGGARGLGLTQASALLEAGATVYALDRLPHPSPAFYQMQTRATTSLNTQLHYRQVDVRDAAALNSTVSQIGSGEGRLDGLIAAAGIQQETAALDYSAADADAMLSINVTGVLLTAQAVAREMLRLGTAASGSIVLVASMSGSIANRGLVCPVYNASKAAVVQLARSLAAEWGAHGIRVNSLSPGYIVTQMVEELFARFPERREKWAGENMLGRLSGPEEYRGAAVFLLSRASGFMTGADLRIDGGHAAW